MLLLNKIETQLSISKSIPVLECSSCEYFCETSYVWDEASMVAGGGEKPIQRSRDLTGSVRAGGFTKPR
jgi:hypothetical protein